MKQYKLVNNLLGWLTFAIAAFTYCMTVEPTASFWDCPEFITTAYKLEVGHPPGAPFFMLTANFASGILRKHYVGAALGTVYPVPILDHYPPYTHDSDRW